MSEELAYVLITPYSLLKSRTGGIIGRFLFLTSLEFVGARMYRPSDGFIDAYIETIRQQQLEKPLEDLIVGYLNDYFRRDNRLGISNRTMLLLFAGENAIEKVRDVAGSFTKEVQGDTVRGTYGDYLTGTDGSVEFFEPAVITSWDVRSAQSQLEILADFAESDGGIIEDAVTFESGEKPETTLVIIKPDSFIAPSSRPGNIIDVFSKTGLYIVATKVLRLSVAQAEEFYGPLKEMFVERLKGNVARQLKEHLDGALSFDICDDEYAQMAEVLKHDNARCEFNKIVEYMSGRSEETIQSPAEREMPGTVKALALLYRGVDAISSIRERLGSTDPAKAAVGTVRSGFGFDLMKNGAHASDSVESAERERKIVGLWPNQEAPGVKEVIRAYLAVVPGREQSPGR
ncbi:MAG: nucleoside-diphosphate kinase [Planctomycetes bacterium]|nr:nucleoside-diphosphate kinase [Planctomycetota bacterium]